VQHEEVLETELGLEELELRELRDGTSEPESDSYSESSESSIVASEKRLVSASMVAGS
jgi:hypothetical protein